MIELGRDAIELFLRGNGALNLAEWFGLSPETKKHFAEIGDQLRGELADMITANTPVEAAARLMGEDPADVKDGIALRQAVAEVEERLSDGT